MKDRNGKDLIEADEMERINNNNNNNKKLYKKDLNDPDNHDGVVSPDILECEVKWALRSTTANKASGGGDGIPAELFKILKDDAIKVMHSICQQSWKTQ